MYFLKYKYCPKQQWYLHDHAKTFTEDFIVVELESFEKSALKEKIYEADPHTLNQEVIIINLNKLS